MTTSTMELDENADITEESVEAGSIQEHAVLKLNGGLFAIGVAAVREFLEIQPFSEIPQTSAHVLGLITVRDENVAVVDLASKLGMPGSEHTQNTRIVLLEIKKESGLSLIGAVTDEVVDVTLLEDTVKHDMPDLGGEIPPEYIKKLARYNDKTIMVLDVQKIFQGEDL